MKAQITCPACQQNQQRQGDFCSFCYAPFPTELLSNQPPPPSATSLYRPADFLSEADKVESHDPPASRPPTFNYQPQTIVQAHQKREALIKNLLIRLFFAYQAISPLVWIGLFLMSTLAFVFSLINLIFASFPFYLMLPLGLMIFGLLKLFYTKVYPVLADEFPGGLMAPIQKTILGLSSGCFLLAGIYLIQGHLLLGLPLILIALGYFILLKGFKRSENRGLLDSFLSLANSTQRIEISGIVWAEKISLAVVMLFVFLGLALFADRLITISQPKYPVKILGKHMTRGGKGGPSYYLKLSGWRQPQKMIELRIDSNTYHRLLPGRSYTLSTHKGIFGGERLKDFQVPKHPPNPAL